MDIYVDRKHKTVIAAHIENAVNYIISNNIDGVVIDVVDYSAGCIDTISIAKSVDNVIIGYGVGGSVTVKDNREDIVDALANIFSTEYGCVPNNLTIKALRAVCDVVMDMKKSFYLYEFLENGCKANYDEDSAASSSFFLVPVTVTADRLFEEIGNANKKLCKMTSELYEKNRDKLNSMGIETFSVPDGSSPALFMAWSDYAPHGKKMSDVTIPAWCKFVFDEIVKILFGVVFKNGEYDVCLKKSCDYSVFCMNDYDLLLITSIFNDYHIYKNLWCRWP